MIVGRQGPLPEPEGNKDMPDVEGNGPSDEPVDDAAFNIAELEDADLGGEVADQVDVDIPDDLLEQADPTEPEEGS